MAKIEIYTTNTCPYCARAKNLLNAKDVDFTEIDLTGKGEERDALVQRTGMRTVPQIFINGQLIGGSDDLHVLEEKGELDRLLAQ